MKAKIQFLATLSLLFSMSPLVHGQTVPIGGRSLSIDLGEGVKMEFVLISPGSFVMGSEKGKDDQKPITKVTLTKPFYLAKYEVTQEQWEAVMKTNRSAFKGTNLPVEKVSWD